MLYLLWEKDNWKTKLKSWLPTTIEDIAAYNQNMNTKMQKIRDILKQPIYRKKIQNIANIILSFHKTQQQQQQQENKQLELLQNQTNDRKVTLKATSSAITSTTTITTHQISDQQITNQSAAATTNQQILQFVPPQHQSQFQTPSHLKAFMNLLKAVTDITRDHPQKLLSIFE